MQSTNANPEFSSIGYELAIIQVCLMNPKLQEKLQRRIKQRQQASAVASNTGAKA